MIEMNYPFLNYYGEYRKVPMKVYGMLVDAGYEATIHLNPEFGFTIQTKIKPKRAF